MSATLDEVQAALSNNLSVADILQQGLIAPMEEVGRRGYCRAFGSIDNDNAEHGKHHQRYRSSWIEGTCKGHLTRFSGNQMVLFEGFCPVI